MVKETNLKMLFARQWSFCPTLNVFKTHLLVLYINMTRNWTSFAMQMALHLAMLKPSAVSVMTIKLGVKMFQTFWLLIISRMFIAELTTLTKMTYLPRYQSSWGQRGAHLGHLGPDGSHVGSKNLAVRVILQIITAVVKLSDTRWLVMMSSVTRNTDQTVQGLAGPSLSSTITSTPLMLHW